MHSLFIENFCYTCTIIANFAWVLKDHCKNWEYLLNNIDFPETECGVIKAPIVVLYTLNKKASS